MKRLKDLINNGKWILVLGKLNVDNAPPAMSIFYAKPSPDTVRIHNIENLNRNSKCDYECDYEDDDSESFPDNYGYPNESYDDLLESYRNMVSITYNGKEVRLYPHEFKELPGNRVKKYISLGWRFVEDKNLKELFSIDVISDSLREIYEAAQLDGCDQYSACMMTVGCSYNELQEWFPPLGYYLPNIEYVLNAGLFSREELE